MVIHAQRAAAFALIAQAIAWQIFVIVEQIRGVNIRIAEGVFIFQLLA